MCADTRERDKTKHDKRDSSGFGNIRVMVGLWWEAGCSQTCPARAARVGEEAAILPKQGCPSSARRAVGVVVRSSSVPFTQHAKRRRIYQSLAVRSSENMSSVLDPATDATKVRTMPLQLLLALVCVHSKLFFSSDSIKGVWTFYTDCLLYRAMRLSPMLNSSPSST